MDVVTWAKHAVAERGIHAGAAHHPIRSNAGGLKHASSSRIHWGGCIWGLPAAGSLYGACRTSHGNGHPLQIASPPVIVKSKLNSTKFSHDVMGLRESECEERCRHMDNCTAFEWTKGAAVGEKHEEQFVRCRLHSKPITRTVPAERKDTRCYVRRKQTHRARRQPPSEERLSAILRQRMSPGNKFYAMWGERGWTKRDTHDRTSAAQGACWGNSKLAGRRFFGDVLAAKGTCNRSWFEGVVGSKDSSAPGPAFRRPPAQPIVGTEDGIFALCSGELHLPQHYRPFEDASRVKEMSRRCIRANKNILRVRSWNMCINLTWLLCAIKGKLHGQHRAERHHPDTSVSSGLLFATAPASVDLRDFYLDTFYLPPLESCRRKFTANDVFFAELLVLHHVCGRGGLLNLEPGESFECELSEARFWELSQWLLDSTP